MLLAERALDGLLLRRMLAAMPAAQRAEVLALAARDIETLKLASGGNAAIEIQAERMEAMLRNLTA